MTARKRIQAAAQGILASQNGLHYDKLCESVHEPMDDSTLAIASWPAAEAIWADPMGVAVVVYSHMEREHNMRERGGA
jgi:hypothetical protein